MFSLNRKVKDLVPYDPIEGTYGIRLDANESYITLPLEIKEEIAQTVKDIHFNRYPDPYAANVCALFAKYYGVPAENVTAGDGSDELISIIMNAFLQKGDTVMTLEKDFSMYSFYTSVVECRHVPYTKNDDYSVDMDDVIATAKKENARIIIFSNPCNPHRALSLAPTSKSSFRPLTRSWFSTKPIWIFQIRAYSPSLTDTTT